MTAGFIDVGGLRLALEAGPDGPRLSIDDPATGSLAAVLNAGATGVLPGLDDALRQGVDAGTDAERARRPPPGDDYSTERERWRQLAGADPGADVYVVSTDYTPTLMMVPRAALLEGLRALRTLRDAPRLDELEQRAADIDRLEASGAPDQRARAAVKRRLLLADLDDLPGAVDAASHPRLAAYTTARDERRRYAAGEQRAQALARLPGSAEPAVSLDWFRHDAPPPVGWSPDAWLAHAEAALRSAELPPGALEGQLLVRDGGGWTEIGWRREDGTTPVVVRAAPA